MLLLASVLLQPGSTFREGRRNLESNIAQPLERCRLMPLQTVRLDGLATQPESFDPRGRDLFRYFRRPEPAVAKTMGQDSSRLSVVSAETLEPSRPTVPTPVTQSRPKPAFEYVGFLGPKYDKIAVFDTGSEVLVAQVGELIRGKFELLEFRYEAVLLRYVDGEYAGDTTELPRHPS